MLMAAGLGGLALLALTSCVAQTTTTRALGDLTAFDGNVGYYATGNTMAEADPTAVDGLWCVLRSNTAVVPTAQVSSRAALLKAYLYYSGNVYTYASSGAQPDLSRIDRNVSLQFPGRTTADTFTAEVVP